MRVKVRPWQKRRPAARPVSRPAPAADARASAGRIPAHLTADLDYPEDGGARVTLILANTGDAALHIADGIHLTLEHLVNSTPEAAIIAGVFPARRSRMIPPREKRGFRVPLGAAEPGHHEGVPLQGGAVVLKVEFWFRGHPDRPLRRSFTFPGRVEPGP